MKLMKHSVVLTAALCLCTFPSHAQTLSELEAVDMLERKRETLEKAMKTLNDFDALLNEQTRAFKVACMKAVGAPRFCECATNNRPVAFSFADYVSITTRTREENQYSRMDKQLQSAYDKVGAVRDACVKSSGAR